MKKNELIERQITIMAEFNNHVTCIGCVRHEYYESGKNSHWPLCDDCIRHGRLKDNFSTMLPDGTLPDASTKKS